jgi:hypothetical protein
MAFDLSRRGELQSRATSPIYSRGAAGRIEGVGTGIFFAHADRAFVLTASHVLCEYMNAAELLIGGRTITKLNGRFFPSVDEDAYDVGFVPLTEEQKATLADVTFLTIADLDLSSELGQRSYYVVGYRSDDNDPEGTVSSHSNIPVVCRYEAVSAARSILL